MDNHEVTYIKSIYKDAIGLRNKLAEYKKLRNMEFFSDEANTLLDELEHDLIAQIRCLKNENKSTVGKSASRLINGILSVVFVLITIMATITFGIIGFIIFGIITCIFWGKSSDAKNEAKEIRDNNNLKDKINEMVQIKDNKLYFK